MRKVREKLCENEKLSKLILAVYALISVMLINTSGSPKYLLLLLLSILCSFILFKEFDKYWLIILIPNLFYVLLGGILAVSQNNFDIFSIKIACFLLIPPIVALFTLTAFKDSFDLVIDCVFLSMVLVYLYTFIPHYNSVDLFESIYAFPFGLFAIYYFSEKKWWTFFISVIVLIMAHKRVAYIGVVLCVLAIVIIRLIKKERIQSVIIGIITIVAEIMAYLWVSADFLKLLGQENFDKYDSGLYFFRGRLHIWQDFKENIQFTPLFIGKGIGYTTSYLDKANIDYFHVIHNDFLQTYTEIGFIGFFIYLFLCSFYLFHKCNIIQKSERKILLWAMIMYTFMLWATDNTQIYISYWIPAWLMILNTMFIQKNNDDEFITARD